MNLTNEKSGYDIFWALATTSQDWTTSLSNTSVSICFTNLHMAISVHSAVVMGVLPLPQNPTVLWPHPRLSQRTETSISRLGNFVSLADGPEQRLDDSIASPKRQDTQLTMTGLVTSGGLSDQGSILLISAVVFGFGIKSPWGTINLVVTRGGSTCILATTTRSV